MPPIKLKTLYLSAIAFLNTFILISTFGLTALRSQPSQPLNSAVAKNTLETKTPSTGVKQLQRAGRFRVVYQQATTRETQIVQNALRETRLLEILVQDLNRKKIILPVDLSIVSRDCGQINAFYSPRDRAIIMCNEFIIGTARQFQNFRRNVSLEKAVEHGARVSVFVFYHELGHALIDVLELPATGKEEDAVDDFAAILLLDQNNADTEEIVLNAALWFGYQNGDTPYWAQHSLDKQRFFNLVCLVYGKDQQKYASLVQQVQRGGNIPSSRFNSCSREYDRKLASWNKLLIPHYYEGSYTWEDQPTSPPPPPSQNQPRRGLIW